METGNVYPPRYSGFIVIRMAQETAPASESMTTLRSFAAECKLHGIEKLLDLYEIKETRPAIRALLPEKIRELEKQAAQTELPPLHSLTSYWKLDVRHCPEKSEEIVKRFSALDEVEVAYRELEATDPAVNPADDPYNANQNYQDAAPVGIDARWAWTQPNGEGAGVGFVDLEQGWFLNHEDFASKLPALLYGDNRDGIDGYVGNHGTAVLGEVIADDNTVGVVGIAPSVSSVNVTSHWDTASSSSGNVADAIAGALPTLQVGDVLLLEIQKGLLPTETDVADLDAIRLAVALGIVVVEAAGNGSFDLDSYTDGAGKFVLSRGSADFMESGAIMVGAALSPLPHNRAGFSNFGSRVDCYGWGENVVTAGYGDLDGGGGDNTRTYTSTFNGTSSASPIISGAALIVQGIYRANTGEPLSPLEMRALLSDRATGTAQGGGVPGNIGVMPDLRLIIETILPRLVTIIADSGNFGEVCIGSFKDMVLTLSNSGGNMLTVTNITSSDAAEFLVPGVLSYPLTIEAGNAIEVPIRFQPNSLGPKAETITVFSNDSSGSKSVEVSGRARAPRLVAIIANAGNFGNACVGSFVDQMITLSNSGRCTLTITSITSSSAEFLAPNVLAYPIAIEAGGSLQIPVRFEPTGFGAKGGMITIISDDPAGEKNISVSGNAPFGKLVVTGSTCIGGVTACCLGERTISICNAGECKLYVTSVAFKRKSRHWKLVNNPFPATLFPGSCLSVLIRYKATEKCPRSCELVITSDDPETPVKTLDVMAYTIWSDCGCKNCDDCRRGCGGKHHDESCSAQGIDACCEDEGHDHEEDDDDEG
ncbi:Abnormal spindle-like microcephaly-assoc'd, ASPM-SPD-2-Hydin [Nitrosospira briensis]|uniref:Abnormal spindle-like microcephaly-assoc'd, ASPM-SPD-2-Hydin n=1 Tax=Nitrosospira briensis TaxID=35799 RepID=A0A1I4YPX6_9PROT|nr:choice-of-anchor D domain-containing protein [Nitrosospira briensis]SFN40027.1 Abnormal spindle-like microcephaly-assoc'd, ASPM-SPD-2-Hydin [Nitrosospira briensis]